MPSTAKASPKKHQSENSTTHNGLVDWSTEWALRRVLDNQTGVIVSIAFPHTRQLTFPVLTDDSPADIAGNVPPRVRSGVPLHTVFLVVVVVRLSRGPLRVTHGGIILPVVTCGTGMICVRDNEVPGIDGVGSAMGHKPQGMELAWS